MRYHCWLGAPRVSILSFPASIRPHGFATSPARRNPCGGSHNSSFSRTVRLRTISLPVANGFLTILLPSMRTSFWCFRRGTQFNLDVSAFKNCVAHFERMKQRPSVRKLLAYEEEVQTAFAQAA